MDKGYDQFELGPRVLPSRGESASRTSIRPGETFELPSDANQNQYCLESYFQGVNYDIVSERLLADEDIIAAVRVTSS
jgi:hypothetical protein